MLPRRLDCTKVGILHMSKLLESYKTDCYKNIHMQTYIIRTNFEASCIYVYGIIMLTICRKTSYDKHIVSTRSESSFHRIAHDNTTRTLVVEWSFPLEFQRTNPFRPEAIVSKKRHPQFCHLSNWRLKYDQFKIPYQRRGLESCGQLHIGFMCDNFKSLVNASGISIKERFAAVLRQMVARIEPIKHMKYLAKSNVKCLRRHKKIMIDHMGKFGHPRSALK
ncbi:hypothetical protein EAG_12010 [Camponotus floridanus]|uniref:Uncharacterized protein n=1 Tax=Camponotus floridanus TaxID=104421 RepID=E2AA92_CAMFO|nr:hypothetical protein EAG_12010 [Camponotus floridanus]